MARTPRHRARLFARGRRTRGRRCSRPRSDAASVRDRVRETVHSSHRCFACRQRACNGGTHCFATRERRIQSDIQGRYSKISGEALKNRFGALTTAFTRAYAGRRRRTYALLRLTFPRRVSTIEISSRSLAARGVCGEGIHTPARAHNGFVRSVFERKLTDGRSGLTTRAPRHDGRGA